MRFLSAGMYFNTTVSSPLYCIVESMLPSTYTSIHNMFLCVCVCVYVPIEEADSYSYLGLKSIPLLYLGVELPGVKGQLHLSQEAVVSKPVVVPHGHLKGSSLQLRVADHVLLDTERQALGD